MGYDFIELPLSGDCRHYGEIDLTNARGKGLTVGTLKYCFRLIRAQDKTTVAYNDLITVI